VVLAGAKAWEFIRNPWTRHGQARAYVVRITTRVSGPIIALPIRDNQAVQKGELRFEIDTSAFAAKVRQTRADLNNPRMRSLR
jgi:multidrug resistance efflux pump